MKSLLISILLGWFVCATATSSGFKFKDEWKLWKMEHGKHYSNLKEEKYRMKIFRGNAIKIAQHNYRAMRGLESYTLKLNQFGDRLRQEVVQKRNGFRSGLPKGSRKGKRPLGASFISPEHVCLPQQVDWRAKGAVTPVKDQV